MTYEDNSGSYVNLLRFQLKIFSVKAVPYSINGALDVAAFNKKSGVT
jgi:hypothetical protein